MKRNVKTSFWKDIQSRYKVTIADENTQKVLTNLIFTKYGMFGIIMLILVFFAIISALLVCFTPLRNYFPGYMNSEVRQQVVDNAMRADSLQQVLDRQNRFVMNIQDILQGKIVADSVQSIDSLTKVIDDSLMEISRREAEFRRRYEETETYNLSGVVKKPSETEGLIFYAPTRGTLTQSFGTEINHFGVDVKANKGESILATLEGTVIMSTYTSDSGFMIAIQHSHDFVSIYKHCGRLLKRAGESVVAGECIAIVGVDANFQTIQAHLHFELWHKGHPVNPETYIIF